MMRVREEAWDEDLLNRIDNELLPLVIDPNKWKEMKAKHKELNDERLRRKYSNTDR